MGNFISTASLLKMCLAAQNHEKFTKTLNDRGSRSFKVIDVDNATVFTLGKSIPAK